MRKIIIYYYELNKTYSEGDFIPKDIFVSISVERATLIAIELNPHIVIVAAGFAEYMPESLTFKNNN